MFITTATRWLRRCDMRLASGEVVVGILEKMVKVADVLSEESAAPLDTMSQGSDDVEVRVDHQEWIRKLNWERTTLTEQYGALYRRLLHALEKAYKCNKLCGDQKRIRELLHDVLEVSHNECGPICEVDGCPWIGHDEPFNLPFHDECDLLSKSTAAGAHGGERLSESEPLSSSGPQSSSSSQPVVSSDSPEGLAHAEPHRTVSHEGLPTPAINTSEHWSSRCSFLATEHNTRRHAMGRVREARSMDELTRPGVTRLEPGRQSSWG
ncbi:uncharacterized protein PHACADRAFT_264480 [Phanerochaete carnosa HHB-10118-sp]|uniref:Uncharacterized protein n=1 Tax=Phanerochaete carnosa (strain HHB-10118-sp) TaxID=650164 RepID=K5VT89_PHACS|nr:uncharacterized protein PHACADRAFT_264480 [Phanerochaete carnosa HHB-10118-sp]EKM50005.1 hypothetical protein PHACADRAFT_264480 [Phanerochaete carnosa HHB-10118-sp]